MTYLPVTTLMYFSYRPLAAGFNLEEVRKLATQTKAIGVILPPPDIRAIVDKTAQFVAKHGALSCLQRESSILVCKCTRNSTFPPAYTQACIFREARKPLAASFRGKEACS